MKTPPRNRPRTATGKKNAGDAKSRKFQGAEGDDVLIWGLHAVQSAIENPQRRPLEAWLTRNAAHRIGLDPDALPEYARLEEPRDIDRRVPDSAVHQGAVLRADPLEPADFDDVMISGDGPLVLLDQVTDPQNVGAVFRSAAAFGARAVILQTRKAPPLSGSLAKAAVGAIETVPECRVVNIARSIDALKDAGWHVVGLAGEAGTGIAEAFAQPRPLAIVLGAEGAGMRQLVAESCSQLAHIPILPGMESLNVSNAAAIALYEAGRGRA